MKAWNSVSACGHVIKPNIKMVETKNGTMPRAQFSMAFPDRNEPDNKDKTSWVRCVAWGPKAEIIEKYCTETDSNGNVVAVKGAFVGITGSVVVNTYTTREGVVKQTTQFNITEVHLMNQRQAQDTPDTEEQRIPTPINRKAAAPPTTPPPDFDRDKIPF